MAKAIQCFTNGGPEAFDCALCCLAQECLELCEGVFDGVEVRTVGREVAEFSSCRLDELANPWPFMARQVIHDDDVAAAQLWAEDLLNIGLKGLTVDGAVEDAGRNEASQG